MNRREALQRVSILLGGSIFGADRLLASSIENINYDDDAPGIGLFSKKQIKLLNEIAETIIPTTNTPGAKAAKVGQFIATMVSDCYEPADQKTFVDGLVTLDMEAKKRYGKTFKSLAQNLRHDFLTELDREQLAYAKSKKSGDPTHYFRMIKELTLTGYFTSEIGATQALRYIDTPGRYDGAMPYKKGDRAFG